MRRWRGWKLSAWLFSLIMKWKQWHLLCFWLTAGQWLKLGSCSCPVMIAMDLWVHLTSKTWEVTTLHNSAKCYWKLESSARQLFESYFKAFLAFVWELTVEGDRKHREVTDDDDVQQGTLAELKFDVAVSRRLSRSPRTLCNNSDLASWFHVAVV